MKHLWRFLWRAVKGAKNVMLVVLVCFVLAAVAVGLTWLLGKVVLSVFLVRSLGEEPLDVGYYGMIFFVALGAVVYVSKGLVEWFVKVWKETCDGEGTE